MNYILGIVAAANVAVGFHDFLTALADAAVMSTAYAAYRAIKGIR
jgi:hypothetical protein